MQEHPYYPVGTQIKMIDVRGTNAEELNAFLILYEGFILNIYPHPMPSIHNTTRFTIIYKAFDN